MPDYRISQPQLLRLALLASGGDTPKFDEVFGIIREARPILDPDTVASRTSDETIKRLAEAVAGRPEGNYEAIRKRAMAEELPGTTTTRLTPGRLPAAMPLGTAPLPPVTEGDPNATGTVGTADDATPPAKPE